MLDRVTITGADDSVIDRKQLIDMTTPCVEWGILCSASNVGAPRFPSLAWMGEWQKILRQTTISSSLHLCGRWVRMLLVGDLDPLVVQLADGYERIQLNFHAERVKCDPAAAVKALVQLRNAGPCNNRQFIFQIDGELGNEYMEAIQCESDDLHKTLDCVGLFDVSGGAGVLPQEWPKPQYMLNDCDYAYHGYAGGLGPHNLAEQLPTILKTAGAARIWIDCETHVRSENDRVFDLDKVRRFLEIANPFVG